MAGTVYWQPRRGNDGATHSEPPFITDEAVHLRILTEKEAQEWLEWETKKVDLTVREMRAREKAKGLLKEEKEAALLSEEGQNEAANRFGATLLKRAGLRTIPDPDPLIDGFLTMDSLVRTWGAPKTYKSFVTLDMAACISLGTPWQGYETHRQKVVYIVAEGVRGMKHRVDAWEAQNECEMDVHFYPEALQISDDEQMRGLLAYCKRESVGYVVFDTQARCTVGVDENSNTEMGQIIHSLDVLKRETGACVHLVHHSGVGADGKTPTRSRGATSFDGAVDAEFVTERRDGGSLINFKTRFQKDIAEAEDLMFDLTESGHSLAVVTADPDADIDADVDIPQISDVNMRYLHDLVGNRMTGLTTNEWIEESGKARGAVRGQQNYLGGQGLIKQQGSRYFITPLGDLALQLHARSAPTDIPQHVQEMME